MSIMSFIRRHKKWIVIGVVTLIIAVFVSPHASKSPDGLDRVAEDHGFVTEGSKGFTWSPIKDYELNIPLPVMWRVAISAVLGLLLMSALLLIVGKILAKKRDSSV